MGKRNRWKLDQIQIAMPRDKQQKKGGPSELSLTALNMTITRLTISRSFYVRVRYHTDRTGLMGRNHKMISARLVSFDPKDLSETLYFPNILCHTSLLLLYNSSADFGYVCKKIQLSIIFFEYFIECSNYYIES